MEAKHEEATNSETKALPPKPDVKESEHMKEVAIEQKIKSVKKIGEAGKP